MRRARLAGLILLALLGVGASPAAAQSVVTCLAAATPVLFGTYDPTSSSATPGTGNVNVTCALVGLPTSVAYSILLSQGNGTFSARALKFVSQVLNYNLYTANNAIWGDGTSGTSTTTDSYNITLGGASNNYTVFGKIPIQQAVPAGLYTDAITVTVSY